MVSLSAFLNPQMVPGVVEQRLPPFLSICDFSAFAVIAAGTTNPAVALQLLISG
jgi:hypothetical protein